MHTRIELVTKLRTSHPSPARPEQSIKRTLSRIGYRARSGVQVDLDRTGEPAPAKRRRLRMSVGLLWTGQAARAVWWPAVDVRAPAFANRVAPTARVLPPYAIDATSHRDNYHILRATPSAAPTAAASSPWPTPTSSSARCRDPCPTSSRRTLKQHLVGPVEEGHVQVEAPAERALGNVALRRARRRETTNSAARLDVVEDQGRALDDALDLRG